MWLKFVRNCETNRDGDVVWTDDNKSAKKQINDGNAVRCLGPDGEIFEDSSPEKIITQLAAEDNISFEKEEKLMKSVYKDKERELRRKASLGSYIR